MTGPATHSVSATVMSHPARGERARRLSDGLAPLRPALSFDVDPAHTTLLGSAAAAWRPSAATHHAVFQDDAVPVPNLPERLVALIDRHPDAVLPLFCEWGCKTAGAARIAALAGFGAVEVVDRYVPTNAIAAPRSVAAEVAAELTRRAGGPPEPDDTVVREVVDRIGARVLLPLPNLTQDAGLPSTVGNDPMGVRLAVCAGTDASATPAPTALTGLTTVPFLRWRSGAAVVLTRSPGRTAWQQGPLGPLVARHGLDDRALDELTRAAAARAVLPPHPDLDLLRRAVAQVLAAITMCAASFPGVDRARLADPVVGMVLDTAVPGALRCLLPPVATPAGGAATAPFARVVVAGAVDMLASGRIEPMTCRAETA